MHGFLTRSQDQQWSLHRRRGGDSNERKGDVVSLILYIGRTKSCATLEIKHTFVVVSARVSFQYYCLSKKTHSRCCVSESAVKFASLPSQCLSAKGSQWRDQAQTEASNQARITERTTDSSCHHRRINHQSETPRCRQSIRLCCVCVQPLMFNALIHS